MKRTKKMLAFLMAALLALPLICTTAFAEGEETFTFTVNEETEGFTYVLYQMFTGDVTDNPGYEEDTSDPNEKYIISNIKWGNAVPESTQAAMYDFYELEGKDRTASAFAERMAEKAADGENVFHDMMVEMARLQKTNGASLENGKTMEYSEEDENYSVSGLAPGYYLVRNTGVPNESYAYSDYIIKILGEDVEADPKASEVTAVKKVDDINQSTASIRTTNLDSSDANIGTIINYTLTSNLPGNFEAYKQEDAKAFRLIFEDDMSRGLTWYKDTGQEDGYATIQFGTGTEIPVNFVVVPADRTAVIDGETKPIESEWKNDGGKLWMLDIENLVKWAKDNGVEEDIVANAPITIRYRAILNTYAVTTNSGNPNKYRVIFDANPNTPEEKMSATEKDTNIVFTYKTIFNKVDEYGDALPGADFRLEKFVVNASGSTTITIDDKNYTGNWVDVTALNSDTGVNPYRTINNTADDSTEFTFTGLHDGHYRLVETTTPEGYNSIDPLEFDIAATHKDGDVPTLESLSGVFTNLTDDNDEPVELTANIPSASLTANIQNKQGIVLPASGGMGTTMLHVIGALLVTGSVVALVVKRRAQAE